MANDREGAKRRRDQDVAVGDETNDRAVTIVNRINEARHEGDPGETKNLPIEQRHRGDRGRQPEQVLSVHERGRFRP